jgi:SAM-dependent methyltransferase
VPGATVVGLDGDAKVLEIARRKAARARLDVTFDEAMAYALPYPDRSFDAVVSSLVFHHLAPEQQITTLAETLRVLRLGGAFVVADLAPPHNRLMRLTPFVRRLLGWSHRVHAGHRPPDAPAHDTGHAGHSHRVHVAHHGDAPAPPNAGGPDAGSGHRARVVRHGNLPALQRAAGFEDVAREARYMTLIGTLAVYSGRAPA